MVENPKGPTTQPVPEKTGEPKPTSLSEFVDRVKRKPGDKSISVRVDARFEPDKVDGNTVMTAIDRWELGSPGRVNYLGIYSSGQDEFIEIYHSERSHEKKANRRFAAGGMSVEELRTIKTARMRTEMLNGMLEGEEVSISDPLDAYYIGSRPLINHDLDNPKVKPFDI